MPVAQRLSTALTFCLLITLLVVLPVSGLEEALKDLKAKDNILPKLMSAGSSNTDSLFDRELKKYDGIKADVTRNVQRNSELLAAIARDAQVRLIWFASCHSVLPGLLNVVLHRMGLARGLRFLLQQLLAWPCFECGPMRVCCPACWEKYQ